MVFKVVQVKRSTEDGVEMMRGYPDVDASPGVEDWLPQQKRSMQKVFDDIHCWEYADAKDRDTNRQQWESLRAWHLAYTTADSLAVDMMHDVDEEDGLQLGGCPAVSWSAMWGMLDARAAGYRGGSPTADSVPAAAAEAALSAAASSSSAPLRSELRGNGLRQTLSTATRASDLNVVSHPGQTDADPRRTRLLEDAAIYVKNNLNISIALSNSPTPTQSVEIPCANP
eukprot:6203786-Pleurochrysis_carterae.AAC.1